MSNQKYTYQEAVALAMQGKTLKTVDSEGETYTLSYDEYGDLRFEGEPHYDTDSSGDEYSYSVEREYNVELNPGVLLELPDELIHLTNCDWEIVE